MSMELTCVTRSVFDLTYDIEHGIDYTLEEIYTLEYEHDVVQHIACNIERLLDLQVEWLRNRPYSPAYGANVDSAIAASCHYGNDVKDFISTIWYTGPGLRTDCTIHFRRDGVVIITSQYPPNQPVIGSFKYLTYDTIARETEGIDIEDMNQKVLSLMLEKNRKVFKDTAYATTLDAIQQSGVYALAEEVATNLEKFVVLAHETLGRKSAKMNVTPLQLFTLSSFHVTNTKKGPTLNMTAKSRYGEYIVQFGDEFVYFIVPQQETQPRPFGVLYTYDTIQKVFDPSINFDVIRERILSIKLMY